MLYKIEADSQKLCTSVFQNKDLNIRRIVRLKNAKQKKQIMR